MFALNILLLVLSCSVVIVGTLLLSEMQPSAIKNRRLAKESEVPIIKQPKPKTFTNFSFMMLAYYTKEVPDAFRDDEGMEQTLIEIEQAYGVDEINGHWARVNMPGYTKNYPNGDRCRHKDMRCLEYPEFQKIYRSVKSLSKRVRKENVELMQPRVQSFIDWNNSIGDTFDRPQD